MKNILALVAARVSRLSSIFWLGASLSLLAISAASAQDAAPYQWAGVIKNADFKYKVWGSNPGTLPSAVRLVEARTGRILYESRSSNVSIGQRFDISQLPQGKYQFVVKIGKTFHRFPLDVQTGTERLVKSEHVAVVSPELMPAERRTASARPPRQPGERFRFLGKNKS